MTPRILTDRLELIASTAELAQAETTDRARFAHLLNVAVPDDWPPPLNDADSMQFNADRLREAPEQAGWRAWYFVLPESGTSATLERRLIGIAGFFGPPSAEGEVEVGYSLLERHQGAGYGTEAVRALVGWAFDHPQVVRVVAQTLPELTASIRLLEKIGFAFTGAGAHPGAEGVIRFELHRSDYQEK